jgi:hypothetical protein
VVGCLKPGITASAAQAELGSIQDEVESQYAENIKKFGVLVTPLQDDNTRTVRATLLTLAAAVGFVLLIACANVAALLMGRVASQAQELALRMTLGAGRARLVSQMLTESLLLGGLGAAAGIWLAYATLRAFAAVNPLAELPASPISIDLRALAFTVTLALVTTVLFGLAPALYGSRVDLISALKASGSGGATARRRTQSLFLAGQIALTVVIVTGAALMLESLWKASVDPAWLSRRINLDDRKSCCLLWSTTRLRSASGSMTESQVRFGLCRLFGELHSATRRLCTRPEARASRSRGKPRLQSMPNNEVGWRSSRRITSQSYRFPYSRAGHSPSSTMKGPSGS